MASAYQLLLHTRLVGLGKRFDRTAMMVDQQKAREQQQLKQQQLKQQQEQPPLSQKQLDLDSQGATSNPLDENMGSASVQGLNSTPGEAKTPATPADGEEEEVPAALQQLKSILPGNLEMDASMMEHLARAAVELHHQRTGRKKSADGLLASPLSGGLVAQVNAEAESSKPKKSSVAWTPSETNIVIKALKEGKDNYTIASTLLSSKTVAQVHAFVKNQQQLHKVNKLTQRQQQQQQSQAGKAAPVIAPAPVVMSCEKPPTAKPPRAADPAQPPRRGGRGRKPPTTAMNTVPNVTMDVRALLRKAKPEVEPSKSDNQGS